MTTGLSELGWRNQLGAVVLLALAGTGVFWNWYVVPARASLAERQAQLALLQADVARAQATAARLPEFRRQVAELELQLDRLRAVLPDEQDVAELLRRVQAMATQSNLAIRGFSPRPVARKQLHMEWPIGLELEGGYHDLGAFLARVSEFPRLINIGELMIRAGTDKVGGPTIVAECTATTFVLIESPAAAPASTAPASAE